MTTVVPKGAAPGVTAEQIAGLLQRALDPTELAVQDDSHLHAGHAGAREGRHFSLRITSDRFESLTRVARHRLIYDALRPLFASGIHAVAIDARAPGDRRNPSPPSSS